MTPEERFASNLRRYRKAAKLTQEQLAAKSGAASDRDLRLERGVRNPRLATIVRLARGLGSVRSSWLPASAEKCYTELEFLA